MPDLDQASLDDVAAFFHAWYPAGNVRLVLCGPLTADEGIELAERHFGSFPTRKAPGRPAAPSAGLLSPQVTTVTRQVPHSLSYLSWEVPPADHPDQNALSLALAVLADGHASRLHRTLVRNADIANEVHSAALTNRCAPSIATVLGRPADQVSTQAMTGSILEEIARFIDEGPTEEELARAVAQYERDWLWELATTSGRADAINEAWLLRGDPTTINTHLSDIVALTPDAVRAAAASWLNPNAAHQLHYLAENPR